MAAAAIDVIGVVSGVLGIVSFFQGVFPDPPPDTSKAGSSHLRIASGMDGGGMSEAGGHITKINLYNEYREQVGGVDYRLPWEDGNIEDGSFTDFTLDSNGQQPTYVQILGSDDAVCVAYITQTWPDGIKRGWSGDMGMICDQSHWAYSNVIVSDDGHKPACTWLDADHTNGIKSAGVQIHMQDFTNVTTDYSTDPAHYCNAPVMVFEENPDPDNTVVWKRESAAVTPKRGLLKRSPAMSSHIIGSQDTSHSALKLCSSDTSYSPDFVSFSEGIFCDMGTKTPWPLCSSSVTDDCYHWENHTLITGGDRKPMNYGKVVNWE